MQHRRVSMAILLLDGEDPRELLERTDCRRWQLGCRLEGVASSITYTKLPESGSLLRYTRRSKFGTLQSTVSRETVNGRSNRSSADFRGTTSRNSTTSAAAGRSGLAVEKSTMIRSSAAFVSNDVSIQCVSSREQRRSTEKWQMSDTDTAHPTKSPSLRSSV